MARATEAVRQRCVKLRFPRELAIALPSTRRASLACCTCSPIISGSVVDCAISGPRPAGPRCEEWRTRTCRRWCGSSPLVADGADDDRGRARARRRRRVAPGRMAAGSGSGSHARMVSTPLSAVTCRTMGPGMSPSGVASELAVTASPMISLIICSASSESRARPHWASASRMMARARPEAVSSDSSRRLAAGMRGPGRCRWVRTGRGAVPASDLAAVPKPDHPPFNATTVGRTLALRWVPQLHGPCDLHAAQAVTVGPPRLRWRQGEVREQKEETAHG